MFTAPFFPMSILFPTEAARAYTAPGRRTPAPNEQVRSLLRPRNRLIDVLFYNTLASDYDELSDVVAPHGSIIWVSPNPEIPFQIFQDVIEFCDDPCSRAVNAITIAGVGSSSVGAVGFARDVATALQVNVAAIVSGYGTDDLFYEALGGAFFLRDANQIAFAIEQIRSPLFTGMPWLFETLSTYDSVGAGPDLAAAKALIRSRQKHMPNLRYVVGHSKGNLVISGAMNEIVSEAGSEDTRFDDLNLILLSAVVAVPESAVNTHQFIGMLDAFGAMNSRVNVPHEYVCGAMHHLNRQIPFYLDAVEVVRSVATKPTAKAATA